MNQIILNNSFSKLNPQVVFKQGEAVGMIAGSRSMPLRFAKHAKSFGLRVCAICHLDETSKEMEEIADEVCWIKLGQLGSIIDFFKKNGVSKAVMVGGISRVRSFKDVSFDWRGTLFMAKVRSMKDDVIMRALADELAAEGIEILDSTVFAKDDLATLGVMTKRKPSSKQADDIEVGREALRVISGQHIGQLVVVKDGVITAVEAVEGSDEAIRRGGRLGHRETVIVKCAKTNQDMRFDVPIIGLETIRIMTEVSASVLSIEAGRCLILDKSEVIKLADSNGIVIVGSEPLVN